jgi:hypothetical protein
VLRKQALWLLAIASLTACGDDGGSSATPDARVVDPIDAEPAAVCTSIADSYGDLGSVTGTATLAPIDDQDPTGPQSLRMVIGLNEDPMPDQLVVELWEDTPPFDQSGLAPRTVQILGLQTDLIACGACVYIAGDVEDPTHLDFHMASKGTLSIDALDPTVDTGTISGSITDLEVRQVTIDADGQKNVVGGCKSTVDSVSFDFDIAAPPP